MAATRLDNFGAPMLVVNAATTVGGYPANFADGFIATTDWIRIHTTVAGAVTNANLQVVVKNEATGVWALLMAAAGTSWGVNASAGGDFRDFYIGTGTEFLIRVTNLFPVAAGNSISVWVEPISGSPSIPSSMNLTSDTEMILSNISDTTAVAASLPVVAAVMLDYTGVSGSYERMRHNETRTLYGTGSRTSPQTPVDQVIYGGNALIFLTNISAFTAGGLQVVIEGKDSAGLGYYPILTSAVYVATGLYKLLVDPRQNDSPNLIAKHSIPRVFRIRYIHTDATPITYSGGLDITP